MWRGRSAPAYRRAWAARCARASVYVSSVDLPHSNDHLRGVALASADENRARQPLQFGGGRLECRNRLEVDLGGIDRLAGEEPGLNVRRRMPHAGVLYIDELAGIGLEHVSRVEFGESVRADDLPIRAAVQDLAAHLRALERAAENGDDSPAAARHVAE